MYLKSKEAYILDHLDSIEGIQWLEDYSEDEEFISGRLYILCGKGRYKRKRGKIPTRKFSYQFNNINMDEIIDFSKEKEIDLTEGFILWLNLKINSCGKKIQTNLKVGSNGLIRYIQPSNQSSDFNNPEEIIDYLKERSINISNIYSELINTILGSYYNDEPEYDGKKNIDKIIFGETKSESEKNRMDRLINDIINRPGQEKFINDFLKLNNRK